LLRAGRGIRRHLDRDVRDRTGAAVGFRAGLSLAGNANAAALDREAGFVIMARLRD
jgi:hypothetical protein